MIKIRINTPIWKTRSVGIAEHAMLEEDIQIEILYKQKNGKRLYPYPFRTTKSKLMSCPSMMVQHGVKLHMIKIDDLDVV